MALYEAFTELDFSILLPAVVTIADEVDAQLKQQMLRFMAADAAKAVKADKADKQTRQTKQARGSLGYLR